MKVYLSQKKDRTMAMLGLIIGLFVLAILCPFILPNKMVSKHKRDHIS